MTASLRNSGAAVWVWSTTVKEDESGSGGFHGKGCRTALAETQESTDERKIFPMGCRVHTAVFQRSSLRPGRVRTPDCGEDSQHYDYACADGRGGHVQRPSRAV